MSDLQKYGFKIIVIGDGGVGKTSLITKFTQGTFEKEYIKTIGAQFSKYDKEIEGNKIKLIFWDIAGQEDFLFLRPSFYRESKAAIIVYSLEENDLGKDSFEHIINWHEDVMRYCGDIPIVLFANKIDLIDENALNKGEIEGVINERNFLSYYITSAKTGQGVIKAFNAIIENLYYKHKVIPSEL
ncbi:MAG: Rab family GTPase [Candidatus Hodarchaeota archaeon]